MYLAPILFSWVALVVMLHSAEGGVLQTGALTPQDMAPRADLVVPSAAGAGSLANRWCPKKGGKVCNNEGLCDVNKASARCICNEGWFGVACESKHCPSARAKVYGLSRDLKHLGSGNDGGISSSSDFIECQGHGLCHHVLSGIHKAGSCECNHPWHGDDCSQKYCDSYEGEVCNGHGNRCVVEAGMTTGRCECAWPFFGESCEKAHCPRAQPESQSQGIGVRVRDVKAFGENVAAWTECSGNGVCLHQTRTAANAAALAAHLPALNIWGRCQCKSGFYGPACEFKHCPVHNNVVCNGGACDKSTGRCTCEKPFYSVTPGGACTGKFCPGTSLSAVGRNTGSRVLYADHDYTPCSGHGACLNDSHIKAIMNERCFCEPGWGGVACDERACPVYAGH